MKDGLRIVHSTSPSNRRTVNVVTLFWIFAVISCLTTSAKAQSSEGLANDWQEQVVGNRSIDEVGPKSPVDGEGKIVLGADGSDLRHAPKSWAGPVFPVLRRSLGAVPPYLHLDSQALEVQDFSNRWSHRSGREIRKSIQQAFLDRLLNTIRDGSLQLRVGVPLLGSDTAPPHTADGEIYNGHSALLLRRSWEEIDDGSSILLLP